MQRAATTRAQDKGEVTYEIMVCSTIELPGQVTKDTWYIAGAFRSRAEATVNYEAYCRQYPDRRLLVALVRSTFDEATRRFHDRVLDAREPVQRLLRSSRELTPAARSKLAEEFGKGPAPRGGPPKTAVPSEPRARRGDVVRPAAAARPAPPPPARGRGGVVAGALAVLAALAGAAWFVLGGG